MILISQPVMLTGGLCLFAYLLGSIPWGVWIAKTKGLDLKKIGSGNIGATNIYRAMGLKAAVLVFVLDMFKGLIPTLISVRFLELNWMHVLVPSFAMIGHAFSCFFKFKGGKSVATGIGIVLGLSPLLGSLGFILAIIIIRTTKIVAIATLVVSLILPFSFYAFNYPLAYVYFLSLATLFIYWKHRSNIVRLICGKENKLT